MMNAPCLKRKFSRKYPGMMGTRFSKAPVERAYISIWFFAGILLAVIAGSKMT
jgi:hypothetical protein